MPRKRFSAFDDFPVTPGSAPDWQSDDAAPDAGHVNTEHADAPTQDAGKTAPTGSGARDSAAAGLYDSPHVLAAPEAPAVERIERLKPSQMMPDRFQPRRLLPTPLRRAFFTGQINCYQAAEQWLQMSKGDASLQAEVERLLKMGYSFEEHGQIKPITGSWTPGPTGEYIFQIETGERRFWAACLQYASHHLKEEPQLRVEAVEHPTRMRQVIENRHAEPPSAVGQACEIASLILAELGVQPPQPGDQELTRLEDEYAFFRQARAQRMPPGLWEKIMPVMDLTRPRLVQLLNILELPTGLLDLADRYRVPERVLREIHGAPRDQWEELLMTGIQNSLTSDDIAILANKPRPAVKEEKRPATPPDPAQQSLNAFKRFFNALGQLDEETRSAVLDELANDLVLSNQTDEALNDLHDLGERIRIRQQNRLRRR
jgi:hypothetical protein